eukprot:11033060-Alexandrium_andersonii.AAC.1
MSASLVGSEMCIRDRPPLVSCCRIDAQGVAHATPHHANIRRSVGRTGQWLQAGACMLPGSDASYRACAQG